MSRFNNFAKDFWANLFGIHENDKLEQELETQDEQSLDARREGNDLKRPSLYVRVFEDMINVIMEKETHLLSDAEWDILKVYNGLDYPSRYLFVRLLFRQPDWHALSSLHNYSTEIGEEVLGETLERLCLPVKDIVLNPPSPCLSSAGRGDIVKEEEEEEEEEALFLTLPDEEEDVKPLEPIQLLSLTQKSAQLSKPTIKTSDCEIEEPVVDPANLQFDYLFRDQTTITVKEALTRLTLPDLREISRSMKVGTPTMRKETLINAMIDHAAGQRTLPSLAKGKSKAKGRQACKHDGMTQTQLSFGQKPKDMSQLKRLREMALQRLGPCVKINPNLCWLVSRLHIIAYRGTEKPTKYCLPALLAGFKKWNFPQYAYERDGTIWTTREDFLEYEEALYLEVEMENPPEDGSTPADLRAKTPALQANGPTTPLKTPQAKRDASTSKAPVAETPLHLRVEAEEREKAPQSVQRARHVKKLFEERVESNWRVLLARKDQEKGKAVMRSPGLERFEAGYVYTKMMFKASGAFGTLKEYEKEFSILEALLAQTHWRKGRRSVWYERCAVVLGHIKPVDNEATKNVLLKALADDLNGLVHRPGWVRRLERVQRRMKLPRAEWLQWDFVLKEPNVVSFTAKRSDFKPGMRLDQNLRPMSGNVPLMTDFFTSKSPVGKEMQDPNNPNVTIVQLAPPKQTPKRTGKSSWVGFSDEAVNVETYALQRYEMDGYVGFHSETRILTTIFTLVFWDIIFSPVPGAFETRFQAGPLDMFEDSFYLARKRLFDVRLKEVEEGKAGEYLKRHDDLFRPKQTWCIGLKWDVCEQKQLLEIVECLGAEPLAIICKLLCEDYGGRSSGVPDLIVWKTSEGICKFVEVKGPGDTPQSNQRLWFDSLLRAGAKVEICRIIDEDMPEPKKRKRKTPTPKPPKDQKGKGKVDDNNREDLQERVLESDDDGDYLPQLPKTKRRKVNVDEVEQVKTAMAPMSLLTNAPPGTPSSGRQARSIPQQVEF